MGRAARWGVFASLLTLAGCEGCGDDEPAPEEPAGRDGTRSAPNEDPTPPRGDRAPLRLAWIAEERARFAHQTIGPTPHGLALSDDGSHLFVASTSGRVSAIETASGLVVASHPIASSDGGGTYFELELTEGTVAVAYSSPPYNGELWNLWRWRQDRLLLEHPESEPSIRPVTSPSGERLLSSLEGGDIGVRDLGGEVFGRADPYGETAFPEPLQLPSNSIVLGGPTDGVVHWYDAASFRELGTAPASRVAARENRLVLLDGDDVLVRAFDADEPLLRVAHELERPRAVAISADGALAAVSNDTSSVVFRVDDGHRSVVPHVLVRVAHPMSVVRAADGSLRRWSLVENRAGRTLAPPPTDENSRQFDPPWPVAREVASVSGVGAFARGNDVRWTRPGHPPQNLAVLGDEPTVLGVHTAPNGSAVLIRWSAGTLLFDGETAVTTPCIAGHPGGVAWEPSPIWVNESGLCDLRTGEVTRPFGSASIHSASPNARFVLSVDGRLSDRSSGEQTRIAEPDPICDVGFHDEVMCNGAVVFASDGAHLAIQTASVHDGESTALYAAGRSEPLLRWPFARSNVFAPDGSWWAHADDRSLVLVRWNDGSVRERALFGSFTADDEDARDEVILAPSPDGALIVWASRSEGRPGAHLWHTESEEELAHVATEETVRAVRWSSNGEQLLVVGDEVRIFDRHGALVRSEGDAGRVVGTRTLWRDGRIAVVVDEPSSGFRLDDVGSSIGDGPLPRLGEDDATWAFSSETMVRLWRPGTGRELIVRARAYRATLHWLVHTPDGRWIADTEGVDWLLRRTDGSLEPLDPARRDPELLRGFIAD